MATGKPAVTVGDYIWFGRGTTACVARVESLTETGIPRVSSEARRDWRPATEADYRRQVALRTAIERLRVLAEATGRAYRYYRHDAASVATATAEALAACDAFRAAVEAAAKDAP